MTITFECRTCGTAQRSGLAAGEAVGACAHCGHAYPNQSGAWQGDVLQACVCCGTSDLYVQKDFPHRLGLGIVVVGSVLSCIAWSQFWYLSALGILLAAAALDMFLYYTIGDVVICYRCLAQHRGTQRNPRHEPFDLGVGERYRQERIRLGWLRDQSRSIAGRDADS